MQPSNLRFIDPSTIIVHDMIGERTMAWAENVLKLRSDRSQRNLAEKPDIRLKEKNQKSQNNQKITFKFAI